MAGIRVSQCWTVCRSLAERKKLVTLLEPADFLFSTGGLLRAADVRADAGMMVGAADLLLGTVAGVVFECGKLTAVLTVVVPVVLGATTGVTAGLVLVAVAGLEPKRRRPRVAADIAKGLAGKLT